MFTCDDMQESSTYYKGFRGYFVFQDCANAVVPSYVPILKKHMNDGYGLKER